MKKAPVGLIIVLLVLLGGNLSISFLLGLGDAEALYYTYSRHLAGAYLDHPPLIGWLIRMTTAICGASVFGVRVVPMLMLVLGMLFIYLMTRALYGVGAARLVPWLVLATPVFSVGLTAATPDAPLFAIWPLYLWQLHLALADRTGGVTARILRPSLLGALLGLAFLAKYTGALLVITTLILVMQKPHRIWLRRPGFWIGGAIAAAVAAPVFLWNIDHGWVGVLHRTQWTQTGAGFSMRNLGALVGGQLLYIGPVMLLIFYCAVRRAFDKKTDPASSLVLAASLPTLAVTYLLVLWSDVAEPHWPAAGYIGVFPAAAALVRKGKPYVRRIYRLGLGLGIAVYIILLMLVLTPLLPMVSPQSSYQPKYDLANELRGWPELAQAVRTLNRERRPILAAFYTQCAQLMFVLNHSNDPPVRCISKEIDDFDIWYEPFQLSENGALFVTDNRFDHDLKRLLPGVAVISTVTVEIYRGGVPVRRFEIIECRQ